MTYRRFTAAALALALHLLCAFSPALASSTQISATDTKRVLIVLSSEGKQRGKLRPGFEMDELSQAYLIFKHNGFAIDIASPKGGAIEADGFDAQVDFNAEFLRDPEAVAQLQNTQATASIDPADFDAVYIAGGKGAMFDLPRDQALRRIVQHVFENGGIIAAVCHGPAALINVKLSNGKPLLTGLKATGFSNEEEMIFGKKWTKSYPFLLEDAVIAQGARWSEAPLMMSHVIGDGRLITGQNPYSTAGVAEALVRASGKQLAVRRPWRDELTMQLMQDASSTPTDVLARRLKANPEQYHMPLIGLVGYYQLQSVDAPEAIRRALKLMQLAAPHMDAPELKLGMATAHQKLGELEAARDLVNAVLASHPQSAEAKALAEALAQAKR